MKAVGRRGFLRAIGLAPLGAKKAADAAISQLTGVVTTGIGGGAAPAPPYGQTNSALTPEKRRSVVLDFFRRFGLPDWEVERMRRDARYVHSLDPDIANKCWSMSVKIITQRERNFQRAMEQTKETGAYEAARDAFREKHGFWFHW